VILAALTAAAAATAVSFPVSTRNAQAQAQFDRGLFLYYAFAGDRAAESFAAAAASDPSLAMAGWGEALADGPDLNTPMTEDRFARGAAAIGRAQRLESSATPLERGFIDAMALRYRGAWSDWERDDAGYRRAMTALAQTTKDENAELLAAEALLEHGGIVWNGSVAATEQSRAVLSFVDDVVARDPANPMANHLCIHAYDDASDRAPALPCAQRLDAATFPPEAEHLAHMPAHYWIETGDYAKALASSERAFQLLVALDASEKHDLAQQRYASHDISVGYSAAMMLGRYDVAQTWAQRMSGLADARFDALTALRFGRYGEAAGAQIGQAYAPWVAGLAALHLGQLDRGRQIGAQIRKDYGEPVRGYVAQLFFARLAEANGDDAQAEDWYRQARDHERADYYAEVIPLIPADEARGGFLLRRGRYAEAAEAFGECLDAYPNDPRALFGLAKALAGEGKTAEAAQARSRFDAAWAGADTSLTIGDL
jgi:tetratricopeptide (TPR) repeat protein